MADTIFYDSVTPSLIPGPNVCLYYDGEFAASASQAKRFKAVRWITVLGNWQECGIADFEAGNPVYGQSGKLREWVQGRANMGARARVYCDRSNIPLVQEELKGLSWLWWIGTLDGDKLSPSYLPGMWGVQYTGNNRFDVSVLYGEW
jgi:hypothetical protein